jgi:carbon-monoxide dehydrogenase medium subunit
MKPAPFNYLRPGTFLDALDMLATHGEDGKILAGGQSLAPAMNFRLARPAVIIDINRLTGLDTIAADGASVRIGALARHAAFHKPTIPGPLGALLAAVVRHIAHYPIRQRGTFAGSLAHADPAAEWALVAAVFDAEITAASKGASRTVAAKDFFHGSFVTALKPEELLTEVRLPLLDASWRCGFYEFARRAGDFALAMALAALRVEDGVIAECRLGVGGVADRPLRLRALEAKAVGEAPSEALFAALADAARAAITPSGDIHATAAYRRDLIGTVVTRALARAAA